MIEETRRAGHHPVSHGSHPDRTGLTVRRVIGDQSDTEVMAKAADIRVGTAGWSIPPASASRFDSAGTHLERYSRRLDCAEINSSFHRPHAATTYAKWRDSTPPGFRFAVKMPRAITHELKLQGAREPFITFLAQTDGLADKRGPLLFQLPPSLSFDNSVVTAFLDMVRRESTTGRSFASRGTRHGSRRLWHRCSRATEYHEWRRTLRRCRTRLVQPAGRTSRIFGCTAHRGRTGHAMTRTPSRH